MAEDLSDLDEMSATEAGDYDEERSAEELAEMKEEEHRRWVLYLQIYGAKAAMYGSIAVFLWLKPLLVLKALGVTLLSLPLLVVFPQALGSMVSALIVNLGTFGYPFSIRYLWLLPYFSEKSLHVQIAARDVGFDNPPGFPFKHFLHVERVNLEVSVTLRDLRNALRLRPKELVLHKIGKVSNYFVIDVAYIDLEGVMINFQIYKGKFNINEFVKLIANNEVKANLGPLYPWPLSTLPQYRASEYWNKDFPNKLTVRVIRARHLKDADSNGKSDPYCIVKCRNTHFTTAVRKKELDPVWDAAPFEFHVTDASTVLHVVVKDRDFGSSDDFLGQWIMTTKYFVTDPKYNHHTEISVASDRTVRGWFPLMSKNWVREVDREGRQSEVELEMRWFYEEGWGEGWEEPRQSALQQLTENSNETKLRLGNIDKVKTMLNNVPILFRFHRVAIRNVRFYLKDLFRGGQGEAEKRMAKQLDAKEARYLEVKHIDWKKLFKPKKEDPGITMSTFLERFFLTGLPSLAKDTSLVGSALGQIGSALRTNVYSSIVQIMPGKGKTKGRSKSQSNAPPKQVKPRAKKFNPKHWPMVEEVPSESTYFTADTLMKGALEIKHAAQKKFTLQLFELKSDGCLYFRKAEGSTLLFIDIKAIDQLVLDKPNAQVVIEQTSSKGSTIVTLLQRPEQEDDTAEKHPNVSKWFNKMKQFSSNNHTEQFGLSDMKISRTVRDIVDDETDP